MELKAIKHIGRMGVIIDDAADKVEAVRIDVLRMTEFYINFRKRQILITFEWGGYDSTGVFRFATSDQLPPSQRTINGQVRGESEIFNATALCPAGNPLNAAQFGSIAEKILFDHKKIHDIVNGGWNPVEMELTYNGQTVFKKEKQPEPEAKR